MQATSTDLSLVYARAAFERHLRRMAVADRILDAAGAVLAAVCAGLVPAVIVLDLMGVI